jgi:GntR family transcriptional regulator
MYNYNNDTISTIQGRFMAEKKLTLQLDFHSGLPIYTQIVNQIQSQLVNGILKPGDQLPTVRALAQELRVNFNTVARAYRILDEARIISTQQGRGTYITEIPPPDVSERLRHESLEALTQRFIAEAIRLGFSEREVSQMVRDSLKPRKETNANDSE